MQGSCQVLHVPHAATVPPTAEERLEQCGALETFPWALGAEQPHEHTELVARETGAGARGRHLGQGSRVSPVVQHIGGVCLCVWGVGRSNEQAKKKTWARCACATTTTTTTTAVHAVGGRGLRGEGAANSNAQWRSTTQARHRHRHQPDTSQAQARHKQPPLPPRGAKYRCGASGRDGRAS